MEEDPEIMEKSPCGRWHRTDQQKNTSESPIKARAHAQDVFLGMDMEEGLEVLWCEIKCRTIHERALIKRYLTKFSSIDNKHLIKVLAFWSTGEEKKVVVITESGTYTPMKFFLETVQDWRRKKGKRERRPLTKIIEWCRQIVSAMKSVHKHGLYHKNISTKNIFIQNDGTLKIGLPLLTQSTIAKDEEKAMKIRQLDLDSIPKCSREMSV